MTVLAAGDQVWVQPVKVGDREWKKATIVKEAGIRSYEVQAPNNQVLIRNRRHLKEAKQEKSVGNEYQPNKELTELQSTTEIQPFEADSEPALVSADPESNLEPSDETVTRTRSGRISRKPKYLNKYYT